MINRLKRIFASALLLGASVVHAQDTLYLSQKVGGLLKFPVSNIDSLNFKKAKQQSTTVTDPTGNVYGTITIGTQTWMQENLRTEKYSDGTAIPLVTDNTIWYSNYTNSTTKPMMSWYNNDKATHVANKNGALYNWYAVSPTTNGGKNVCPINWHVPTDGEWTIFENYLIANGFNYDGTTTGDRNTNNKIAKALASTTGWNTSSNTGSAGLDLLKNNSSKFSILPSGYRSYDGFFIYIGDYAFWWSASVSSANGAWSRNLNYFSSNVDRGSNHKSNGFSVRCVRD